MTEENCSRRIQAQPSQPCEETTEHHIHGAVAGNRGGHPLVGILIAPRPEYPNHRERGQPANNLNRAGAAAIEEPSPEPEIVAQLGQPSSAPYPMGKDRIGATGKQCSRRANRAQPPAIHGGAERDDGGNSRSEHLQKSRQRSGRAVEFNAAQKEGLGSDPVPRFSSQHPHVRRAARKAVPGEAANHVHNGRRPRPRTTKPG